VWCGGVIGREVAAGCHVDGRVFEDGPADEHVEDVTREEPGEDKNAECDVTDSRITHVLEQFGGLWLLALLSRFAVADCTYRQDDIHQVHYAQYDDSNTRVVVAIRQKDEYGREDVVHKHLQVVFTFLLNVYDKDLLEVESPLNEVVELEQAFNFSKGPALPDTVEIQPEIRVVCDVLLCVSLETSLERLDLLYHAQRP